MTTWPYAKTWPDPETPTLDEIDAAKPAKTIDQTARNYAAAALAAVAVLWGIQRKRKR